jgi:DNA modification methylase
MTWSVHAGDCRAVLATLPDESVQCCVTSPPYWGLRDYGVEGQIGLEPTPEEYVANMVEVFREVRRVLRPDGTLWLNLGDCYCSTDKWGGGVGGNTGKQTVAADGTVPSWAVRARKEPIAGLKPKDLVGIPWMLAFALRADGWWLRSDIVWHKPNPMPESVTDRPTKAHEYVFLLTKSATYFYDADAIQEKATREATGRNARSVWTISTKPFAGAHFAVMPWDLAERCVLAGTSAEGQCSACGAPQERETERIKEDDGPGPEVGEGRKELHGPTYSRHRQSIPGGQSLVTPGEVHTMGWRSTCSCGAETVPQTVLDPFAGAGTVGMVARRHGRRFIGIELSPVYAAMARERIADDMPLLNRPVGVA